jgi:hypothetical protein
MTGVGELVANDGKITVSAPARIDSPRRRGIKKGLFIFLLTFLVVPIVSILTIMVGAEPFGVAIASIILFVGGILRMVYALMFESSEPLGKTADHSVYQTAANILGGNREQNALPPSQSMPASSYMPPVQGKWRETNDLEPSSVTDPTTKLLEKDR